MQKFDKVNTKAFYKEVGETLEKLAKAHGMTFELGNAKFSENEFSGKYTFKTSGAPSVNDTLADHLKLFHPKLVGQKVQLSGKMFTIVGFDRKKRKNNIIIEDASGKRYRTYSGDVYAKLGIDGSFWG